MVSTWLQPWWLPQLDRMVLTKDVQSEPCQSDFWKIAIVYIWMIFAIHIMKFDSQVIGQIGSIFNSDKETIINW